MVNHAEAAMKLNVPNPIKSLSKLLTLVLFTLLWAPYGALGEEKKLSPAESCRADIRFEMERDARRGVLPELAKSIASSRVPSRDYSKRFQPIGSYELNLDGRRVVATKGRFGITVDGEFKHLYNAYRFDIERESNHLYIVDTSSVDILPKEAQSRAFRWDQARANCLGMNRGKVENDFFKNNTGKASLWDLPVRTNFGHIELLNKLQEKDPTFLETLVVVDNLGRDGETVKEDYIHAMFIREAKVGTRNGFVPDAVRTQACYGDTMYAYLFSESYDIRYLVGLDKKSQALGNQSPIIDSNTLQAPKRYALNILALYSYYQTGPVTDRYVDCQNTERDCNEVLHEQLESAVNPDIKRQIRIEFNKAAAAYQAKKPGDDDGIHQAGLDGIERYVDRLASEGTFYWYTIFRGNDIENRLSLGETMNTIRAALEENHVTSSIKEGGGLRVYCMTENPK